VERLELLGSQIKKAPEIERMILALHDDFQKDMQLGVPYSAEILFSQARAKPLAAVTAATSSQQTLQTVAAQASQEAQARATAAQATGATDAPALLAAAQAAAQRATAAKTAADQAALAVLATQQLVPQTVTAELKLIVIESSQFTDTVVQRREISEVMLPAMMPGMPQNRQIVEKVISAGWERQS
jgi:hypothetical protein